MDASLALKVSRDFDAISVPHRLRILDILAEGETCFGDVREQLGIRQQCATMHMKILRLRGFVSGRRAGRRTYYSITDDGRRLLAVARAAVA